MVLTERVRIERELRRSPQLREDGTATWSLTTLQRALRDAPDGLPRVSTFTLLHALHEMGYTWQKDRTLCKTGTRWHKGKKGVEERHDPNTQEKQTVIEHAYLIAERLGLELWCEDEGGPYQSIPQPGSSWQLEGQPARRPHEYLRGEVAKLLTLFRPATGEVRAEAVEHSTNAVLHPWLKRELEAILKQCPPAPGERAERDDAGRIGISIRRLSSLIAFSHRCGCCSSWTISQGIRATVWCSGAPSMASSCSGRPPLAPGSIWPSRSNASSRDER